MGRHAYDSPDMILKIRRANEAAAERKGSGVPWRHRLGTRERREFVMAEIRRPAMRGSGGRGSEGRSRGSELDIQRAVLAARNPKESKFGECLINVNTKEDPVLKLRLGRIGTEMRRMEFRMQQLKQHFMKNNPCLNHEPLILVERPASPQVKRRAKVIEYCGEDPEDLKIPGYMRPLRSRCKTPSTLTTIDAFTLRTRKKRNVWEQLAMDDREAPTFRSTVRPSAKLTPPEKAALQVGWDAHKPRLTALPTKEKTKHDDGGAGGAGVAAVHHHPHPPLLPPPPHRGRVPASTREANAAADTPFVTQLPASGSPPRGKDQQQAAPTTTRTSSSDTTAGLSLLKSAAVLDQLVNIAAAADTTTAATSSQPLPEAEDEISAAEKAQRSSRTATPTTTTTATPATTATEQRPKRKVAIVDKPFFITQRNAAVQ